MRLKILLSSAAILTVLIGTAGFAHDSWAEKGVVLSPQTGWAVTNVADDGSGGGAYCAMARRFRDNLILTVARNSNSESSLALDFPQGQFDTHTSSSIILDPGAGEQRTYEVRPVSKRAYVIRLGNDQAFFSALEKTGILRAEIGEDTYNFSLPDIASGQTQLAQCLNGGAAPQAAAAPTTDSTQYRKDMADLQQKIDALHDQNSRLADVLEKNKDIPSAAAMPATDNTQINALNSQIAALQAQNDAFKAQIDALQKNSGTSSGSDAVLQSEIDHLRTENAALTSQLSGAQSKTGDQAELEHKVQSLQEENTHLSSLLQNTNDSFKKLADESKRLQDDLAAQSGTSGQVDILNAKVASLTSDNARLQQDLAVAKSASDMRTNVTSRSLEDANNLLKAQIATTNDKDTQLSAMTAQLKLATAENDHLKEQIGSLGKTQNEEIQKKVSDYQNEIAKLQTDLQKASADALSAQTLAVEKQQLVADRDRLTSENIKLKGDALAANTKVDGEMSQKLAALQAENIDLKSSSTKDLTDVISARSEVSRLQSQLQQLQGERDNLKETLASAQGNLETKVNGEIDLLKKENDRLKGALDQEQQKTASLQTVQGQYDALRAENEKLKTDVVTASTKDSTSAIQLKDLMDENSKLKDELSTKQAQASNASDLNFKLQSLEADNKRLNEALTVAQNSSDISQNAEIVRLTSENARLQKQAQEKMASSDTPQEVKDALDDLQKTNAKLAANLETTNAQLDDSRKQISDLQNAKPGAAPVVDDKKLSALEDENAKLKSENDTLKSASLSPAEINEQIKNLKLENEVIREQAQKEAAAKDKAHSDEVASLKKEVTDLQSQNASLNGDLKSLQQAMAEKASETKPVEKVAEAAPIPAPAPKQDVAAKPAPVAEKTVQAEPAKPDVQAEEVTPNAQPEQAALSKPQSKRAYTHPEGTQNEAQALEAELAGELQERKTIATPEVKDVPPAQTAQTDTLGPVVAPVTSESLPAAPQNEAQQQEQQVASASAPIKPSENTGSEGQKLGSILQQADIKLDQPMASGPGSAGAGSTLYHWNAGKMLGMAEQRPMGDAAAFDGLAQQYLEKAQKDCKGDFAVMLDRTEDIGKTRIDSYEAACVGGPVSSGATLVFYNDGGTFTALAHKSKTDDMEGNMEARDHLIDAIAKSAG